MKLRTKKQNPDGIVRLETSGEIKEIMINENFLKPKLTTISLCFRGKSSSGIIELTPKEVEMIKRKAAPGLDLFKGAKVMKFKK
jgi:hypothetical protein